MFSCKIGQRARLPLTGWIAPIIFDMYDGKLVLHYDFYYVKVKNKENMEFFMTATTFDTLTFSKKLQNYGFVANQADGLAEVASVVIDDINQKFVNVDAKFAIVDSKFVALDKRMDTLEHKFDNLEHKVDAKISHSESTLIKWMIGISMGLFSTLFGTMMGIAFFIYRLLS
jgi:hypothetical protein